ncbi:MAG: tetratricopeptide repeat protein, partial [Blastocatellia bacterium]
MRNHKEVHGLLCLLAGLLLSLNNDARCQNAQKPEIRELKPGVSVERELTGGDEHHYRIVLAVGQHASFQIVKQGSDVTLTLKGPAGESLPTADFETSQRGVEIVLLVAQTAGAHTLIVKPTYEKSRPARYIVKVDELREASEQDRRRVAAQQIFVEADRLFSQETEGTWREALKKLSESLPIWRSVEDRVWEARTLHRMGLVHQWMANYREAINHYNQALDHYNQALEIRRANGDKFGEAETLSAIGEIYTFKEETQKAIEHFNQALVMQQSLNERWSSAVTFFALGRAYWYLSESEKAGSYYVQALEGYREAGDNGNEAVALADLGNMQVVLGDFQAALDNVQRSLALFREVKSRYSEVVALHHLGDVYHNLGEPEKALEYYKQALPILQEIKDSYAESYVLTSMGIVYNSIGDRQKGLAYLNRSLPLSRKVQDRRGEAGTLRWLGRVYREMGDLPKALECLNQALRLARESNDAHNEAGSLTVIGEVYAAMGDYQKAIESLNRALSIRRENMNRRGEATTLYSLAVVERDRGNLTESRARVEEAIKAIESLRAKVVGTELRRSYFAAQQGSYDLYVDLLMRLHEQSPGAGHDARALQASESARARTLLESLIEARANIRQGADPALLDRERSLQKQLDVKENQRLRAKHTP